MTIKETRNVTYKNQKNQKKKERTNILWGRVSFWILKTLWQNEYTAILR